jgi:hypothetical protein
VDEEGSLSLIPIFRTSLRVSVPRV